MTLKEAQELLNNAYNDFLSVCEQITKDKTKTETGAAIALERVQFYTNHLLEAARVVEIEKIKQFLEETICSCKCEHLNAKELLDNQTEK